MKNSTEQRASTTINGMNNNDLRCVRGDIARGKGTPEYRQRLRMKEQTRIQVLLGGPVHIPAMEISWTGVRQKILNM